ncbi:hypothetical protein PR048_025951 [Dryococelus australis]|uniref:Uncharacterized protein n=1 Tax=Dryococelus australis TaxID=614101 RepID=A0ABQ9GK01_9NEOP|nr:hypothetical protein PR048_025951 [Dryococelus australis]
MYGGSYVNGKLTNTLHEFTCTVALGYNIIEKPNTLIYLLVIVNRVDKKSYINSCIPCTLHRRSTHRGMSKIPGLRGGRQASSPRAGQTNVSLLGGRREGGRGVTESSNNLRWTGQRGHLSYSSLQPSYCIHEGATVTERLACSPPTKANRVQSPAGPQYFLKWDLTGDAAGRRFSQGSPVFPAPSFRCGPIFTSITLIGSEELALKNRPNIFTHATSEEPCGGGGRSETCPLLTRRCDRVNHAKFYGLEPQTGSERLDTPHEGGGRRVTEIGGVRPVITREQFDKSRDQTSRNVPDDDFGGAGFLGDLPFPALFHSGAAPYSPRSPSMALRPSLLRAMKSGEEREQEGFEPMGSREGIILSALLRRIGWAMSACSLEFFTPGAIRSRVEPHHYSSNILQRSISIYSPFTPPPPRITLFTPQRTSVFFASHLPFCMCHCVKLHKKQHAVKSNVNVFNRVTAFTIAGDLIGRHRGRGPEPEKGRMLSPLSRPSPAGCMGLRIQMG